MAVSSVSEAASRRVRPRCSAPVAESVAPLVVVLAGNVVTSIIVLSLLNTADTCALRRLHPAVPGVVAGVPWADVETPVFDVVRWRTVLPAAVSALVVRLPQLPPLWPAAEAALAGVTNMVLRARDKYETTAALAHLPPSLRVLRVHGFLATPPRSDRGFTQLTSLLSLECDDMGAHVRRLPPSLRELRLAYCDLPPKADFRHLASLRVLSCATGRMSSTVVANLPPSLEELDVGMTDWPRGTAGVSVSLAHLRRLRVLRSEFSDVINTDTVASLRRRLSELVVPWCKTRLSFARSRALQTLNIHGSKCDDASLASLPPTLVTLDASSCKDLTPAAVLPYLPALMSVNLSGTSIGDALVASLPLSLVTLKIISCHRVTGAATLDHLPALRELHFAHTYLSAVAIAACRARGCVTHGA